MKILLSGAGITSNTLAYFVSRQGHRLTIVERAPALRDTGLQVDLRGPGGEVIRRMGLEERLKERVVREEGIQVVDRRGRRRGWFPSSSSSSAGSAGGEGRQITLSTEWEVMRGELCRLLYDTATSSSSSSSSPSSFSSENQGQRQDRPGQVKYIFGTSIQTLRETPDSVAVSFSTGETDQFDLVIGADGQNSKVRELLLSNRYKHRHPEEKEKEEEEEDPFKPLGVYAGLFTTSWPLDHSTPSLFPNPPTSQTKTVESDDSLIGTAYLAPSKRAIFTRRHRPDRIQVYLFCRTDSPSFAGLRKGHLTPRAEKELLISHFEGAGWETERLMRALECAEDFYCERIGWVRLGRWSSLARPSFSSTSTSGLDASISGSEFEEQEEKEGEEGGRIVLVGDAAYAPSVTTGMGTTAGVVGAYVLAGEIGKCCGSDSGIEFESVQTGGGGGGGGGAKTGRKGDGLRTAVREYERVLRPFIQYIQKDLAEGSSAWDSMPETRFGVGVWNAVLGLSSWLRVDAFGSSVREDKRGDGWMLPDYSTGITGTGTAGTECGRN